MPNENETGVSREDARNAEEALFGDMAADPADGQEAKSKTDKELQGSDVAEQQAGPPEDLKVVVSIREGRATIGVQRPSSDPHIESFDEPDPSELVREVSAVIERASARWEDAPKYPAHARHAPSTGRRPRREQGAAQASSVEGGAIPLCRYLGRFRVFGTTRAIQWERRQRPQPASLSLFEWAVGPEEVGEEELVGTRR